MNQDYNPCLALGDNAVLKPPSLGLHIQLSSHRSHLNNSMNISCSCEWSLSWNKSIPPHKSHCRSCLIGWYKVQLQFHALHISDNYDMGQSPVCQRILQQDRLHNQFSLDMEYGCHKGDTVQNQDDKYHNLNSSHCHLV